MGCASGYCDETQDPNQPTCAPDPATFACPDGEVDCHGTCIGENDECPHCATGEIECFDGSCVAAAEECRPPPCAHRQGEAECHADADCTWTATGNAPDEGMCEDAATFACPDGEVDCHGTCIGENDECPHCATGEIECFDGSCVTAAEECRPPPCAHRQGEAECHAMCIGETEDCPITCIFTEVMGADGSHDGSHVDALSGMSLLQVGACKEIIGDKEVQVKASCDGGSGGDVCDFSRLIHCLAGPCDETDDTIAQWIGQCHRVADAMNGMECGDGTGGRR